MNASVTATQTPWEPPFASSPSAWKRTLGGDFEGYEDSGRVQFKMTVDQERSVPKA